MEILSYVFDWLVDGYYDEWRSPPFSFSYRWVAVLGISRFWYGVGRSNTRLFRFIDLEVMPPDAVKLWLERSGKEKLYIWLPDVETPSVDVATRVCPAILSRIARVYYLQDIPDTPWSKPKDFIVLKDLVCGNRESLGPPYRFPSLAGFSHLTRLHFDGFIPAPMWFEPLFPRTLEVLEVFLDLHEVTTDRDDLISALELSAAFQGLDHLTHLTLSSDALVRPEDYEEPAAFTLPTICEINLELREEDFDIVAPLLPKMKDRAYDISFRPYPWQHRRIRDTEVMVHQLELAVESRIGTFTGIFININPAEVVLTLLDANDGIVSLQVAHDFASYYRRFLEFVDPQSIKVFKLKDSVYGLEDYTEKERTRGRSLVEVVRVLTNVEVMVLKTDVGYLGRDLLIALGGKAGRAVFGFEDIEYLEWPEWRALHLEGLRGSDIADVSWSTDAFIGLALVCINHPQARLETVKAVRCALDIDYVRGWNTVVPTVVASGESSGSHGMARLIFMLHKGLPGYDDEVLNADPDFVFADEGLYLKAR